MSLASISSTVQGLFGSRGRSRSHRGSLGGEEEEDVALSLAGNSSAIPATFSDSFHYSTPYRLLRFFFFCFFLCFSPHTSHCPPPTQEFSPFFIFFLPPLIPRLLLPFFLFLFPCFKPWNMDVWGTLCPPL